MIRWIKKAFLPDEKIRRLFWAALALAILISGWNALISTPREMAVFVRISMKSTESGQAALYYDKGRQFNTRHVSTARVHGNDRFHDVMFKIPFLNRYYNLRFDPPSESGNKIVINKIDIVDHDGRVLYHFKLDHLKPAHQIKTFVVNNDNIHLSVDDKANDPQIRILVEQPISFDRLQLFARLLMGQVIPGFLVLFLAWCLVFIFLIYVWSRWKDPVIATLVVLAIVMSGWRLYDDLTSVYFKLSMKSAVPGSEAVAELFHDVGYGLLDDGLPPRRGDQFNNYVFKVPRNFQYLRLDPMTIPGTPIIIKPGTVLITGMEITDRSGHVLKSIPLDQGNPEVKAEQQIEKLEFLQEGLRVTPTDGADDPQINILLDDASLQRIRTLTFQSVQRALIDIIYTFALLVACIMVWRRYKERIGCFIEGTFFQEKLPLLYLGCALGLILAMAFISGMDVHPDELGHASSARYYSDAWLPPAVQDPEVVKTISGFGVSYLFRLEIVYFWAGKFASLLAGLVDDHYLRLRLFNVMLFLILLVIISRKIRPVPLFVLALVFTPQIWYSFSYFNGDGFAFFIALLLAWQLIDPGSMTHRYLNSTTLWGKWSGGALFGIFVGTLLLSKMNYYLYIVFILFIIAWDLISRRLDVQWEENRLRLKKWALVACVAMCVYLPPMLYDQYINDFKKVEKIINFVEQYAAYAYKPSTISQASDDDYPGLHLKSKGSRWHEIFLEDSYWRNLSFYSFFGVYAYMNLYSDHQYYHMLRLFLFGMLLFIYFYAVCMVNLRQGVVLSIVLLFLLLAIGQSTYLSWTGDFQPQGRYLFPMIPIALVGLSRLPMVFQKRMIPCFNIVLFIFSLTSFVFFALLFIPKIG